MSDRSSPSLYVAFVPPGKGVEPVDVSERVLSLSFDDEESKIDKLELSLDNYDLSLFDEATFDDTVVTFRKGQILRVSWGYAGDMTPPRDVVIQATKGGRVLQITALAKSILMNKQVKSRVFDGMKRSDVIAQIAIENGYGPDRQFIEDTEVTFDHVQQAKMTDAQFMMHLAKREGFQFYVDFDGLHFQRRKMNTKPVRTFTYYFDPGQGDILDFNIESDVTITPGAVKAKGRDPLKKSDIDVTANDANTPRDGLAPELEVVDPRTKTTKTVAIASDTVIATSATNALAAAREAKGKFIQGQQSVVVMSMSVIGDPTVSAKMVVEVTGISKRYSGKYYVKAAKHRVSAKNYTLDLTLRSDGSHGLKNGPAQSSASQNKQDPSDPNTLVPKEVVDPRTKETKTIYVKQSGGAP